MIQELPFYVNLLFILTSLITVYFIWKAAGKSKTVLLVSILWLALTAGLGLSGFYRNFTDMPPRFMLLVMPPMLCIILLFSLKRGRKFIDSLDSSVLTLLHSVRLPVELSLLALFIYGAVPELMTFEGRNPDIISGITAPIIFYFGYVRRKIGRSFLIAWNFVCLAFLVNIVTHAILAAPFPFQKIGFEQPNVGVFYYPFVWLPGYVVPAVLFSHLVSLRGLLANRVLEPTASASIKIEV